MKVKIDVQFDLVGKTDDAAVERSISAEIISKEMELMESLSGINAISPVVLDKELPTNIAELTAFDDFIQSKLAPRTVKFVEQKIAENDVVLNPNATSSTVYELTLPTPPTPLCLIVNDQHVCQTRVTTSSGSDEFLWSVESAGDVREFFVSCKIVFTPEETR